MLENSTSIAQALLLTLQSTPCGDHNLVAGVLSHAPGDGAVAIAAGTAQALGMEIVKTRLCGFEQYPGTINLLAHDHFAAVVTKGRPVLLLVDAAHEGEGDTLSVMVAQIAKQVGMQPCAILAISTSAGEQKVARQLALGLGVEKSQITISRTSAENARLVEAVFRANAN